MCHHAGNGEIAGPCGVFVLVRQQVPGPMFNPHETQEDGFAHKLAMLFFASVLVLISLFLHFDSALKYSLLTSFGDTVEGRIVALQNAPQDPAVIEKRKRENPRNFLKNPSTWTRGDTLVIDYRPKNESLRTLVVTLPANLVDKKTREAIDVVYLPVNPKIAYPAEFLAGFAFDNKVFKISLIIGLVLFWLGLEEGWAWARFRRRMRRY